METIREDCFMETIRSNSPRFVRMPPSKLAEDRTFQTLLGYNDDQLAIVDPAEMNLLSAREIPSLSHIDVSGYLRFLDDVAAKIKHGLQEAERQFHASPRDWKNDIHFFRLGYVCWYVDEVLGIRYREDQRDLTAVRYTDPSDLFLNGVLDTRRGTCANMAMVHVALGWRLRWPVSLATVGAHFICRYDDGKVTHNIEATNNGKGGFHSHPDEFYLHEHRLPDKAKTSGSDLRTLTPRELLGSFVGLRARHLQDTQQFDAMESDYLLARAIYPCNRYLHLCQMMSSVQYAMKLFERDEQGHPVGLASWLREVVELLPREPNSEVFEEYTYSESGRETIDLTVSS